MSWQVLPIRFGLSSSVHYHRLIDFIIQGSPAVKLVKFFRGFCGLFESVAEARRDDFNFKTLLLGHKFTAE